MTSKFHLFFLFLLAFFFTKFFAYYNWSPIYAGWFSHLLFLWILYKVIVGKKKIVSNLLFKNEFLLFYLLSFFSLISVTTIYKDSLTKFYQYILPWSIYLLYFLFHQNGFKEKTFINVFVTMAIFTFFIQILQILFPSINIFGIDNERDLEIRNGILRYRLDSCFYFSIFSVFYFWSKFLQKRKMIYLVFFVAFFISVYLFLARQILFVVILTVFFSFFYVSNDGGMKKTLFFMSILFSIVLCFFSDELLGEFISKTLDELDEENIRFFSYAFFLEASLQSPLTIFFGNGTPSVELDWQENLNYHTADVGIIGQFFHYGILPIIIYFYVVYLLLMKYANHVPLYLKLFVLCIFFDTLLIHPFQAQSHALVWISVVYLAELHIIHKNQSEKTI